MTIRNVTIGDKFRPNKSKHLIAEVVDFVECRSMTTGNVVDVKCVAKLINGMATNSFEAAFSSVALYRVK